MAFITHRIIYNSKSWPIRPGWTNKRLKVNDVYQGRKTWTERVDGISAQKQMLKPATYTSQDTEAKTEAKRTVALHSYPFLPIRWRCISCGLELWSGKMAAGTWRRWRWAIWIYQFGASLSEVLVMTSLSLLEFTFLFLFQTVSSLYNNSWSEKSKGKYVL